MSSAGIDREQVSPLGGFAHVEQSVAVILTTPIGTRIMRREFGSELFDLIDRPMTDQVILAIFAAATMAIARWEPRFTVTSLQVTHADAGGNVSMAIGGRYFPRGHLGDYSVVEDASTRVIFEARR